MEQKIPNHCRERENMGPTKREVRNIIDSKSSKVPKVVRDMFSRSQEGIFSGLLLIFKVETLPPLQRPKTVGPAVLRVVVIHTPEVCQGTSIRRQSGNWWPPHSLEPTIYHQTFQVPKMEVQYWPIRNTYISCMDTAYVTESPAPKAALQGSGNPTF